MGGSGTLTREVHAVNLSSTGGDSGQFKYFFFERISYPIVPLIPASSILMQFRCVCERSSGGDSRQFRCTNAAV
jgi:hypothetical protein